MTKVLIGNIKGPPGPPGATGNPGMDGIPCEHKWDGTVLTVTSASGTTSADLRGAPGADGSPGKDGTDGKTPVRGEDYWSESDKAEIISSVLSSLPVYAGEVVDA